MDLGGKFVPKLNGESRIRCSEGATETIFECLDGTLGCFDAMIVGFDELKCHLLGSQVSLYDFRGLIVNDVQFRRKSLQNEILKNFRLGRKDVMLAKSSPGIGVARMALVSEWYMMKKQTLPLSDRYGNLPVQSL